MGWVTKHMSKLKHALTSNEWEVEQARLISLDVDIEENLKMDMINGIPMVRYSEDEDHFAFVELEDDELHQLELVGWEYEKLKAFNKGDIIYVNIKYRQIDDEYVKQYVVIDSKRTFS